LGADKIIYLTEQDIKDAIGLSSLCMACLNGQYPVDVKAGKSFVEKRSKRDESFEINKEVQVYF